MMRDHSVSRRGRHEISRSGSRVRIRGGTRRWRFRSVRARPGPPDPATWHAEPVKVFDNLFYVGEKEYSAWAVNTSDGIIIIDTIFDYSVEDEIAGGLKKLGLDPASGKANELEQSPVLAGPAQAGRGHHRWKDGRMDLRMGARHSEPPHV
jgi:hypothetical protein